jgi:hypothetical protein
MTYLDIGMRIRVVRPLAGHESLQGNTGTVQRLRPWDGSGWVRMDEPTIPELRSVPGTDHRRDWMRLLPNECEAL